MSRSSWSPMTALVLLLLLVPSTSSGVERWPEGWLPVTPEELALKDSPIEPGARAEATWCKSWILDQFDGDWNTQRDVYVRLKIFTEAGAEEYAKIDIDFPLTHATIGGIRARVVQPDGAIRELDPHAVITDVQVRVRGEGVRRKSFALAGVRPGCVVEYKYHLSATGLAAFAQELPLQFDIPTRLVAYHIRPIQAPGLEPRQLTFHVAALPLEDGVYAVDQRSYQFEPDSPPEWQVKAWMLTYYRIPDSRRPDEYWRDFGRREWERADAFTRPDKPTVELARQICSGTTGDLARAQALTGWMRLNFRVLRSTEPESLRAAGVRKNRSAKEALQQRAGSMLDADLSLIALARAAGMEARLLRVPTRDQMFFQPSLMAENFLQSFDAALRIDGRWVAYDVAIPRLPWDMLFRSEEGQMALLCDRDSSRFIETAMSEPERSTQSLSGTLALDETGTLEGDLVTTYTGHLNQTYRELFEDVPGGQVDSVFVEALGWHREGIEASRVQLDRGLHEWDPLVMRFHVRLPEHATVTERRMILEPSAMRAHESARFTAATRRLPISFEHPWSERDSIRIAIPAGWKVESVNSPEPAGSEGVAQYRGSCLVREDGREVLFVRSLVFGSNGSIYFRKEYYPTVKRLFDQIHQGDEATVTFVRESRP